MAVTVKKMVPGTALTASLATYYTAADATKAIVKEIILCNTDSATRTVDVHLVPSGGSAAVGNQILQDVALVAGETKIFSLSSVLTAGDFIQASASSAGVVSMAVSGVELT